MPINLNSYLKIYKGAALAIAAAVLFGISTPLAKLLLHEINPWMLAGLLYLGSGLGLAIIRLWRLLQPDIQPLECHLRGSDWGWLLAAISVGGLGGSGALDVRIDHYLRLGRFPAPQPGKGLYRSAF